MRAPSPEKADLACFSLTKRQPTTLAIRNKHRTRSGLKDFPLRGRRSPFWQNPAARRRRARAVYGSTILARSPRPRKRRLLFQTIADNAPVFPIRSGQSCLAFSAGAKSRATSRARSPSFPTGYAEPAAGSPPRDNSDPPESARYPDEPLQFLARV